MIVSETDARAFCGAADGDAVLAAIHRPVEKSVANFLRWPPERATYTLFFPRNESGGDEDYFVQEYGSVPRVGGTSDILQLDHKFVLMDGLSVNEYSGIYFGQVSGLNWGDGLLTRGTNYVLETADGQVSESGCLVRLSASWPRRRGSIRVIYAAGFTSTELLGTKTGSEDYTDASDIRYATLLALQAAYNEAKSHRFDQASGRPGGAVTSESIQGYSFGFHSEVAAMLTGVIQELPLKSQLLLQRYRLYGSVLG